MLCPKFSKLSANQFSSATASAFGPVQNLRFAQAPEMDKALKLNKAIFRHSHWKVLGI
jgi:hypothetical protein